ncbi:MAG: polyprenol monophosphomannose synthase [Actinomycetota bacterium]|nr:polyprenol monophosphomannose synthase [Actinomycetota bacterium]
MSEQSSQPGRALVIVPTYNEVDSIPTVAKKLFATASQDVDLLVVDDASPDGTADAVRSLGADHPNVHLLERPRPMGLGTAYIAGFLWALERDYWAVVEMDADLSHDPADVPRLLDALKDASLVVGSRYIEGGGILNWGRIRKALSGAGNVYARIWLGFEVRDSTSGFRAYRTDHLARLRLDTIRSEGYAFQIEMVRRMFYTGAKIREIPIVFADREAGKSKMSKRIVFEALGLVTAWGFFDRVKGRRRHLRSQAGDSLKA